MENKNKIIQLVKQAMDVLNYQDRYDRISAMKAHIVGLQGEKRVDRIEHREYGCIVDDYQHRLWDLFDVEYYAIDRPINLDNVTDITNYLETHISRLWTFRDELSNLADDMIKAGYLSFSKPLTQCAMEVENTIVRLRREYIEYNWAKKEYHHISRYEVGYYNVHDEAEKKEGR